MLESITMHGGHSQKDRSGLAWIGLLIIVLSFRAGFLTHLLFFSADSHPLLAEAEQALDHYFLGDPPSEEEIERGLVSGLVGQYDDPHTIFVEPATHELQSDDLAGEYGGIGAFITRDEDGSIHLIPFEDGPADEAGISEGDVLIQIDQIAFVYPGKTVFGKDLFKIFQCLTYLFLLVGQKDFSVVIIRLAI